MLRQEIERPRVWPRASDLPRRPWWGYGVKIYKTFEVLLFKVLSWLNLYQVKKSIIGIPSLATRGFTLLQATVYNGTREEVLGYQQRRFLHRIVRGLPDIEMYERLRLELDVSDTQLRRAEASTETRGFVQLQLPWEIPWYPPKKAWLRIQPQGVETLFGRIPLGEYQVTSAPVFFLHEGIKWVLVSDIDDTIKDSNIAESTSFKQIVGGLIKGHYYRYEPILGMAEFYRELAAKGVMIIYLTSTPFQLAPFLLQFLKQCQFPEGPVFLRWLGYGRVRHKWRTLHKILSHLQHQQAFLIGDSGEQDLSIYRRVSQNPAFAPHVKKILIRHVPGTPLQADLNQKEGFYNSLDELRQQFDFILKQT